MKKSTYNSIIKKIDKIHEKRKQLNKLEDKLREELSISS